MTTCKVEKMRGFKVIGFGKDIPMNEGYTQCPKFWQRIFEQYLKSPNPDTPIGKAILDNCVGELGVCIHEKDNAFDFCYMIAGFYQGGDLPVGMTMYEFKPSKWAKFTCVGALPNALQKLNDYIWQEWIPNSTYYEPMGESSIEWYSDGDPDSDDYVAEIWIPVRDKPLR